MSDESLEVRPDDLLNGRAIPPELIRDLKALAATDAVSVVRIAEQLAQLDGITTGDQLKAVVREQLPESNSTREDSLVRLLLNVKPGDVHRILNLLDLWRKSSLDRSAEFSDEMFANTELNLAELVSEYTSIALFRKANQLLRAVGNEYESVGYYCDLRPVFDDSRQHVEGFVALVNMRLLCVSQDGNRHACEVALTEDELKEIVAGGQAALKKLDTIKAMVADLPNKVSSGGREQ